MAAGLVAPAVGLVATAPALAAAPVAPAALIGPADDPVGTTAVDDPEFAWTAVAGVAGYELQMSESGSFANAASIPTVATRYRPTSTLPQDQYRWRVRSLAADGTTSPWSAVSSFRREWLDTNAPGDPDGAGVVGAARPLVKPLLDADGPTAGVQLPVDRFTVSWSPVRRAAYYVVEVSTDPGFSPGAPRQTCRTPHTQWTSYGVGVYSGTAAGKFGPCDMVLPTPPLLPFVHVGGTYYLRVRAVDQTPDDKLITSLWSNAARPGPAASTATATSFTVVASVDPPTAAGAPAVPKDPWSGVPTADAPLLRWSPVTGAKAYLVGLARDSSFNTSLLDESDLRTDTYMVTTNTELVVSQALLDNSVGTAYHWIVLPCSEWVAAADPANACVGADQAINMPAYARSFAKLSVAVTGAGHVVDSAKTVSLFWNDQALTSPDGGGVSQYEVEVRNAAGLVVDDVETDNTGFIPAKGTYADGTYAWRVRAIDASGAPQDWSAVDTFSVVTPPPAIAPADPGAPAAGAPGPGSTTSTTTPSTGSVATLRGTQAVAYGRSADIAGTLTSAAGAAVGGGGAKVAIQVRPAGSSVWKIVAAATTASTGGFTAVVTPKVNSRYRAVFAGTAADPAAKSGTVSVSVVPAISLKVSATLVRLGSVLTFTGALKPAHADTDAKLVLQCRTGTRWVRQGSAKPTPAGAYRMRLVVTSRKAGRCRVVLAAGSRFATATSREAAYRVR